MRLLTSALALAFAATLTAQTETVVIRGSQILTAAGPAID